MNAFPNRNTLHHPRKHARAGSTTVIALLMLLVLSMVGATVLLNSQARYNATAKNAGWQEALFAAEAGADVGLANCRWTVVGGSPAAFDANNGWSGPNAQGVYSYTTPTITQSGEGTNKLWAAVQVDTPAALKVNGVQWYRIRSTGYAPLPGMSRVSIDTLTDPNARHNNSLRKFSFKFDRFTGAALTQPQATRTVEIIAQPKTPWSAGVIANSSFSDPGSAGIVDSFDSRDSAKSTNGMYDATKRQSHGDVIVNTGNFNSGGPIYGNVGTNGGNVQPSSSIHGKINNSVSTYTPPVTDPTWTTMTNIGNVSSNTTIYAGTGGAITRYKIGTLSQNLNIALPAGQTSGTVYIWQAGDFAGDDLTGSITVQKGVTVKMWFDGDIKMKASDFQNLNNNAANLQLYGVNPVAPATQTITINSPGSFYGAIYAPGASVKFVGNADIMGAIVASTVQGNGNTSVHYDEALAGAGIAIDYRRASWVEDDR
jgi:hypothetical protein